MWKRHADSTLSNQWLHVIIQSGLCHASTYFDLKVHWRWTQREDLQTTEIQGLFCTWRVQLSPFHQPHRHLPSALSSCICSQHHKQVIWYTQTHTQSYGKMGSARTPQLSLLPQHLAEIHTMVPLPQLSRTLAETLYNLRSSDISVTFPQCFEKVLVICVPTYPWL